MDEAIAWIEKANADLEPELMGVPDARERLEAYARAGRMVAYGMAALARRIDNASELARATGTSIGRAKETIATSKVLGQSAPLEAALRNGDVSGE